MIDAPDYCAPLIAWRLWQAAAVDGAMQLVSMYHTVQWPVRKALESECLRTRLPWCSAHQAPVRRCRCGIYATTLGVVRSHLLCESMDEPRRTVVGRVSLWGSVLECERGWRASHAYPERLYVPALPRPGGVAPSKLADDLAAYGVPVALLDSSTLSAAVDEISALAKLATPACG
jgi:hypothetical protein